MKIIKILISLGLLLSITGQALAASTPSAEEMWQVILELKEENRQLHQQIEALNQPEAQTTRSISDDAQLSAVAQQQPSPMNESLELNIGGFIRADLGAGSRYGNAASDDRIGISRAALAITPTYKNAQGVFVLGTEVDTTTEPNADSNIDIKDAYIVLSDFLTPNLTFSFGAQPLLFGIKPNGYPGDRSIQVGIDYGADGAFAVSEQAGGPAIILEYATAGGSAFRFGLFDGKDYALSGSVPPALATDGSSITDNFFIQWKGKNLLGTGLYGQAGLEQRYIGDIVDDSESIWSAGIGWEHDNFDFSLQYVSLDKTFNGTTDDDTYVIAKTTITPSHNLKFYLDYSESDELDIQAARLGTNYDYNDHVMFSLEYSHDDVGPDDFDSVDARVTWSY